MGNFLIGKVSKVLPNSERDQVIEAVVGTEFKVKAYPLHTIQQVKLEDEVLLIKVSEQYDTYLYLLLRLNQEFKYHYNQMVLGFNDENSIIIKAPDIILEGNVTVKNGNLKMGENSGIDVTTFNNGKNTVINQVKRSEEIQSYVLALPDLGNS